MGVRKLERKEYITAEFLYRSPVSSFIGLFKVFPELCKLARKVKADPGGAIMEIWDIPDNEILYRMEI